MTKILLASTFSIFPPSAGGRVRIYHLYKSFSKDHSVNIISLTWTPEEVKDRFIGDNLREKTILFSRLHGRIDRFFFERINVPITDAAAPLLSRFTPNYRKEIQKNSDVEVLIASHPYFVHELLKIRNKKHLLIYEAHNVEYLLKKQMYPNNFWGRFLLKQVFRVEKIACQKANLIVSISEEEKKHLAKLYRVPEEKIIVVPNGVNCDEIKMKSFQEKIEARKKLNLKRPVAIFVGSAHPPNLEAAKCVINMAELVPSIDFLLIGGVCNDIKENIPTNIKLMGFVKNNVKEDLYKAADIALNPMRTGSGSNLKILEYFAAGIPCITTPVGSRGYDIVDGKQALVCKSEDFAAKIKELISDKKLASRLVKNGRIYVEKELDWKVLAKKYEILIDTWRKD